MQAYLEDVSTGGGEPIDVEIEKDGEQIKITMSSLRKQGGMVMVLHIDARGKDDSERILAPDTDA